MRHIADDKTAGCRTSGLRELVEEGEVGALRLVGLGEEGVKILEVNTELRGDKLYATIRAVVDGVEEVYKIQILPPARPREVFRSTREGRGGKGEGELRGANRREAQSLARRPTAGLVSETQAGT